MLRVLPPTNQTRLATTIQADWFKNIESARSISICSIAVRIPGFYPGGPGSIPGMEKKHFFILLQ